MYFGIKNKLYLSSLKAETRWAIKQRLTMANPKHLEAERMRRSTRGISRELKFYEEHPNHLVCPRGFARQAYQICQSYNEDIQVLDERRMLPQVDFTFAGKLRELQRPAVANILAREFGLLSAGTGAGKTVMGLAIIADRRQPTLIIVHTKELLNQWIDRIEQFLAIPREEVGIIGGGKFKIGDRITVATVQSLYKRVNEVVPYIGHLVVDECHRAPSRTFTEAVSAFNCWYMIGLTATPWRRDGLSKVIFWYMGDVAGQIDKQDLVDNGNLCEAAVHWVKTEFSPSVDASEKYSKALSELTIDETRNRLIAQTVAQNNGHGISLVLSDRKDHCSTLRDILKNEHGIEAGVLTGATPTKEREQIIADLKQGKCQYLVATGQLIGEGFDLPGISTLFLTTPVKFSGRLIQYIGRALRPAPGKDRAIIFDFLDVNNPIFSASARARHITYQQQQIQDAA